jgi:hypothetical protein
MSFRLEDMERKLLRLALSPSAQGGEITTSAIKLINTLRARGVESSAIENALEGNGVTEDIAPVISKPDWGLIQMPWGKYKGSLLMDIPPSYLQWALRTWTPDTPGRKELLGAIKNFLNQANQANA